jgi:hypothetical protein
MLIVRKNETSDPVGAKCESKSKRTKTVLDFFYQHDTLIASTTKHGDNMIQVGDLVIIGKCFVGTYDLGKIAIVENVGTWSCDIRIIESNTKPRYPKNYLIKLGAQQ